MLGQLYICIKSGRNLACILAILFAGTTREPNAVRSYIKSLSQYHTVLRCDRIKAVDNGAEAPLDFSETFQKKQTMFIVICN